MIKKRIALQISLLVTMIIFMSTVMYAWFVRGISTNDFVIRTGDVLGSATLYFGVDEDLDGILNKDNEGKEIYNVVNNMDASIVSGRILTYKMIITNLGTVDADIDIGFTKVTGEILIQLFAIEGIKYIDPKTGELVEQEKNHYLPTLIDSQGQYSAPYFEYNGLEPNQSITVFFQLVCLGFHGVALYHSEIIGSELEPEFIEKVNEAIYIKGNHIFGIEGMRVAYKSTQK